MENKKNRRTKSIHRIAERLMMQSRRETCIRTLPYTTFFRLHNSSHRQGRTVRPAWPLFAPSNYPFLIVDMQYREHATGRLSSSLFFSVHDQSTRPTDDYGFLSFHGSRGNLPLNIFSPLSALHGRVKRSGSNTMSSFRIDPLFIHYSFFFATNIQRFIG